jgi:predicted PurR-regulated permease PerM
MVYGAGSIPASTTSVGSLTYKNKISNMETLSFTFGVLSVIIVAFVAMLVWGIVKVVKQQKQINSISSEIERVWQNQSRMSDELHQRISQHQDYSIRQIDETRSYIDSRIDKLSGTLGAKQLIKG